MTLTRKNGTPSTENGWDSQALAASMSGATTDDASLSTEETARTLGVSLSTVHRYDESRDL